MTKSIGQDHAIQTFDQQLYAIAQQVKWALPTTFDCHVLRMGGFHTHYRVLLLQLVHCNSAQSLCDIVRLGREQLNQENPLLSTVEQEETVAKLLTNMLGQDKNESVIVNGLSVIQTLLEFRKQSPEGSQEHLASIDTDRLAQGVSNVLLAVTPRLKDFHNLLVEPPQQRFTSMPTTIGTLEPPLGNTRLQIARLVSALVLTNTHSVNIELANLGTIGVLFDLFFQYVWNNFVHVHVTQCVNTILYNSPVEVEGKKEHPLLAQLFAEFNILQKIIDVWEENDQQQSRDKGRRRGYMGHLTKIANEIVAVVEKGENCELVKEYISETPEEYKEKWESFVTGALLDINKRNAVELISGHNLASSSEDDDADFRDLPFPADAALQQAFSEHQLQQMTSNFIDTFGFNDEEFVEQDDKIDSSFNERISSIDFNIQASDTDQQSVSMFEQACNERIQQFDDNDSDEDIWEEKEITFSPQAQQQQQQPKRSGRMAETVEDDSSDTSTDSEEELDSPRKIVQQPTSENMDVDANDAWTANFEEAPMEGTPVAMDTSPWSSTQTSSADSQQEKWADFTGKVPTNEEEEEKWADFSSISDLARTDPGPRSSSPVAMDTTDVTEANSRTAAYLAKTSPADLLLTSIDTVEGDKSSEDIQQEEVSSSEDVSPSTSEEIAISSDTTPSSSQESQDSNPKSGSEAEEPSSSTAPPEPTSETTEKTTEEISSSCNPDSKNDSFLASSGLLKTDKVIEDSVQHVVEIEVNGPSTESTKLSLEDSSSDTKEEKTDSVINPVANGPADEEASMEFSTQLRYIVLVFSVLIEYIACANDTLVNYYGHPDIKAERLYDMAMGIVVGVSFSAVFLVILLMTFVYYRSIKA
ncbi:Serine/threonine-protein phosphatase 6 regulatory subunit 1,Serine/threonine-protein phosphatase 6 regulatory subunit 3 [Mytilus edulis]|uniref:Serine/threonine-protein phosphatase 6 regulatory subunit 1,Serine/threonine-protein phosphatase 6 regulatory subunit 3 n=1 Tax=Mytilus edulis TaxID=6550 RepID=A0A8S3T6W0_MYTED|nr:Serine/threonine-protein phosphatase 6 regulatory subunit 1,Serine/threonine-protein phosphatase 6 regulatory subunit 3 [Mytilus edulis]